MNIIKQTGLVSCYITKRMFDKQCYLNVLLFSSRNKHEDATLHMLDSIFKNITWDDYLEDEDIKFIKDLIKVCTDLVFFNTVTKVVIT